MRSLVAAGTALVCLAAVGCAKKDATTPATGSSATTPPVTLAGTVNDHGAKDLGAKAEFELEIDNFYFSPTFIKAAPGSTVKVELHNEGSTAHTFTIDALKVDKTLQPGDNIDVPVRMPASGALAFYCRFHRGQGMQGALYGATGDTVAPGASASSSDDGGAYGG
jgi:plastocyanin